METAEERDLKEQILALQGRCAPSTFSSFLLLSSLELSDTKVYEP